MLRLAEKKEWFLLRMSSTIEESYIFVETKWMVIDGTYSK
jgi:hypothetical protein